VGQKDAQYFLANAYAAFCRAEKQERPAILRQFLMSWASLGNELPDEFDDVKSDLLPVLRARTYFEVDLKRVAAAEKIPDIPYSIIADSLCATLVYDLPASMRQINQENLDKWGVSFYEAMEVAKANLQETTKQVAQIGGLYAMMHGDSYDAARLLLTDSIRKLDVKGDVIAMAPNREALFIAGSDDEEALQAMVELTKKEFQHERFISAIPLRLEGDEWAKGAIGGPAASGGARRICGYVHRHAAENIRPRPQLLRLVKRRRDADAADRLDHAGRTTARRRSRSGGQRRLVGR
jgi:hypothetical protein